MNMEKSITDLSPSPTQLNDFCNRTEQKKKKKKSRVVLLSIYIWFRSALQNSLENLSAW